MTKNQRILLMALGAILILVIIYIIYKVFFEFDNTTVQNEVQTAASQYGGNAAGAAIIINDAIKHILLSTYLTQQVLDYAAISGLPKEQVLVNAAVAQAVALKYI